MVAGLAATGEDTAYFELSFSPNVSLVSTVRRFVSEFYARILSDEEATSHLAVATHELLDNAVLYSHDGNTSVRIGVCANGSKIRVNIDTRNRATPDHIVVVRRNLDSLLAAEDPNTHYQALMRETVKRVDGSGLGLARVRAEADMSISYEIRDDLVHVRATAHFENGKRA